MWAVIKKWWYPTCWMCFREPDETGGRRLGVPAVLLYHTTYTGQSRVILAALNMDSLLIDIHEFGLLHFSNSLGGIQVKMTACILCVRSVLNIISLSINQSIIQSINQSGCTLQVNVIHLTTTLEFSLDEVRSMFLKFPTLLQTGMPYTYVSHSTLAFPLSANEIT